MKSLIAAVAFLFSTAVIANQTCPACLWYVVEKSHLKIELGVEEDSCESLTMEYEHSCYDYLMNLTKKESDWSADYNGEKVPYVYSYQLAADEDLKTLLKKFKKMKKVKAEVDQTRGLPVLNITRQ